LHDVYTTIAYSSFDFTGWTWTNTANAHDVNSDDAVSPIDALLVINFLNLEGSQCLPLSPAVHPPPFYDVTGDGHCTPEDVVNVVNRLNAQIASIPEGEPSPWLLESIVAKCGPLAPLSKFPSPHAKADERARSEQQSGCRQHAPFNGAPADPVAEPVRVAESRSRDEIRRAVDGLFADLDALLTLETPTALAKSGNCS
jgi:hypothetical protein